MNAQTAAAAVATLVSLACTVTVARRARERAAIRAPLIAWTIAFGLFTIADAALWYGAARGWTGPVFRLYYLTGGILVVAYLAVGELLLVLARPASGPGHRGDHAVLDVRGDQRGAGGPGRRGQARRGRGGAAERRAGGHPAGRACDRAELGREPSWCWSARCCRPAAGATGGRCWWRSGVGVVAITASATRFGSYTLFALGQALGVVLIYLGLVTRRSSSPR